MSQLLALIDGVESSCDSISVTYPAHPDDPHAHQIQADLSRVGVIIRILRTFPDDDAPKVVEVVEILRKNGFPEADGTLDWDAGDGLGLLHEALQECIETDIPMSRLMDYLLQRTAEVAILSGISIQDFTRSANENYKHALVDRAKSVPAGEA